MSAWIEQHVARVIRRQQWRAQLRMRDPSPARPKQSALPISRRVLVVVGDIWQSAAIFKENAPRKWQCERTGPFLAWMHNLSLQESLRLVEARNLEYEWHDFTPDAFKNLDIAA